jgi:hypothetical protein
MALPTDVIGNILVYACESPKDAAARRWCPSKAWLEAYEAPALWRTLTLSTLPTNGAHGTLSAWARAPQRLRRAVERHTREVVVRDATSSGWREKTPYRYGRGLEGQQFARLRMVSFRVYNKNTQQSIEEDEAALQPLFGAECVSFDISDYGLLHRRRTENADCYLRKRRAYEILGNFTNLRRLDLCEPHTDVLLEPDSRHHCLVALDDDDRVETHTYMTQEQARRLTELNSLSLEQFLAPGTIPANFFQHMQCLFIDGCEEPIYSLPVAFAQIAAACPSLRMLILVESRSASAEDPESWEQPGHYAVFAHVPRTLKALVLAVDCVRTPPPDTASSFAALVKTYLPAGMGLHVITCRMENLDLPKAPWAPSAFPVLGEDYDDAALAQDSFMKWY